MRTLVVNFAHHFYGNGLTLLQFAIGLFRAHHALEQNFGHAHPRHLAQQFRHVRRIVDHLNLRWPVFGQLVRKVSLARFSRTFATLVRSGVPIMSTLDIVANTSGNQVVMNAVLGNATLKRSFNVP